MRDAKRQQRLRSFLEKIDRGEDVAVRDLKSALTDEEFQEYQSGWALEKERRTEPKPEKLKNYERYLKVATIANTRFDSYTKRGNEGKKIVREKLKSDLEIASEHAYQYLLDACKRDEELILWLDRTLDQRGIANFDDLPKVITSRSTENQGRELARNVSKRQLKIQTIEAALATMEDAVDTQESAPVVNDRRKDRKKMNTDNFKF